MKHRVYKELSGSHIKISPSGESWELYVHLTGAMLGFNVGSVEPSIKPGSVRLVLEYESHDNANT